MARELAHGIASDVVYQPDIVIVCGQSNVGWYGSPLASYPLYQRKDPSVGLRCEVVTPQGNMSAWPSHLPGSFGHCLAARLRGIGMRPMVFLNFLGGASSGQLLATMPAAIAAWTSVLPTFVRPRFRGIVWSQGETYSAAWRTETEQSIALLRAAFGASLRAWICELSPLLVQATDDLMRGYQRALVSYDTKSSLITLQAEQVSTVDGIHYTRETLDVQAKTFVTGLLQS
jgi:hypothetical protein